MANERPAEKPADKPSAKTRNRSRHRSGHSTRPQAAAAASKNRPRWTWREYVLQLSVVILGVVVTFVGSGLVERWRQTRGVRTVMQLVVEELKANRSNLEHVCEKLRYDRQGMLMFQQYDMDVDRIPADSLLKYNYIIGAVRDFSPRSDALEVLKASGAIVSVGDKQLLLEVLACYTSLEEFGKNVGFYNKQKIDAMNHLFANLTDFSMNGNPLESWKSMMNDPLCAAFIGTSAYFFGGDDYFTKNIDDIDHAVAALTEKYRFE